MSTGFSNTEFYKELESVLPTSLGDQRKIWVASIIEKNIDIRDLASLLNGEYKVASRFLWLLSEIGLARPDKLFAALPFLLDFTDNMNPVYKTSFANFWLIAGIPPENEGKAIDMSFQWLLSNETNVTIKSRSVLVLFKLTKKYPEIKEELKLCLEDQMDKYSNDFRKRAVKILRELERI
ncbi:MAG: hypothetical protein K0S23_336 [Fluviicola sp.]|jgi:hypothetical protein|uniref:hypothetical protein n=1 Tax=Fluviicola sp. TaxID=1917219 RepID=UPI00261141EF|nr:hypothetical protein [Fluviicola sp.]MDF3026029.1 hypothetical protein [Fluviicola sp.]